ncbi:MAG: dipeptide/oligopeptide/nickel ABC transporter permease/ATP-binding protein [Microbacterium sp.]|uniref:dipeptide/oligopeptide/nickel ABC transporter permease/ATP-binding protein n=1 Tax=Microbacterium sp. TaxID=51671 RepID=UPI0039E4AB2A
MSVVDSTQTIAVRTRAARTRRGVARTLLTRPLPLIALSWLVLVVGATIAAPWVAPGDPLAQSLTNSLSGPNAEHPLGTDGLGRDILSRLLFGGQVSLIGVAVATIVAVAAGTALGVVAGYLRGAADTVLSICADILMSIPTIIILLSVAAVVNRDQTVLMVALGLLMSASVFRVVRAATLDVRAELFVTAARTSGLGSVRILATHIMPRIGGVLVVQATIVASVATVTQVGLGFLGVDVAPPAPSWGGLMLEASTTVTTSFWQVVPPTLVVGLSTLAFSIIGDSVQESLTDRTRRGSGAGLLRRSSAGRRAAGRSSDLPRRTDRGRIVSAEHMSISMPTSDGSLTLVDDVSFHIDAGEIVALVGESGAGKSVTARAILGLLPAGGRIDGTLLFEDVDVAGASPRDLRAIRGSQVAYISQEPMVSLSPSFRVGAQLVEIIRTHRGGSRAEARRIACDLLTAVEIRDVNGVMKKYPHELSGGMAQRVVIAIALAGEPKLLVADEPTTALDVSVQMQILELLRRLQRTRALAVLFVTHDWGVVADVCDRALVMYAGQVVEEADVETLFAVPRHPYSAALRAADPHALVRHMRLATIEGQLPPPGEWPSGCRFADRCTFARAECRMAPVVLESVGEGHEVRCLRVDELGVLSHG